ncbi:hypothetical protein [Mesorhizobium sp. M1E.F.Ca.ET.063.01.1.1]|uniref:hypothetical protein n=1 Tax=Mesorhizobium sp. M1E.F.Ca.ET.063.01.1.1 TaxID=2496750 RepID=UPI00167C2C2C|nr:hypothetical protein [Mesorhizobium sp. M1E.F.Ca.ET.063.01.1.1]
MINACRMFCSSYVSATAERWRGAPSDHRCKALPCRVGKKPQGEKQKRPARGGPFLYLVAGTRNPFCHNIVGLFISVGFGEFEDAEQLAA